MSADASIIQVPYGDDPLRHLATRVLDRHQQSLPDLSHLVVLFPHRSAIPRFRRVLQDAAVQQKIPALLPPYTATLAAWASSFAGPDKRRLSDTAREILLLELLHQYPKWRREYGDWPLADSLLALMDELTRHNCLPEQIATTLHRTTPNDSSLISGTYSPLSDEAQLVQTIFTEWLERMESEKLQDLSMQYLEGLARSPDHLPPTAQIYLAGFVELTSAEQTWIQKLLEHQKLTLLIHGTEDLGSDHPLFTFLSTHQNEKEQESRGVPFAMLLDRTYESDGDSLRDRAKQQQHESPDSPAVDRLHVHVAADTEYEARAIDLQVRRWMTHNLQDIGIITNDRKLARRVRALLERSGVGLADAGGWALSTTSAATILVRWLDCVESNFPHQPLLDLLKSPFLGLRDNYSDYTHVVSLFERTVLRAYNIHAGLNSYRRGLERANKSSSELGADTTSAILKILADLEQAARDLSALISAKTHDLLEFLDALRVSLDRVGLTTGFDGDDAGRELLDVLDELHSAARRQTLRLSWASFRTWLHRAMEQRRFHPPMRGRGVELMSFAESRLYHFDALILAGAVREHLPGHMSVPPYFNDSVRNELGLPSLAQRYAVLFQDFRRLLESAPKVLITLSHEQQGEPLPASPWVERLTRFHDLAYGQHSLRDAELEWLTQQPETTITVRDAPLPDPVSQPQVKLPPELLPTVFSATDFGRLINCPYQFYASRGLNLFAEEEIREEIEKKEYGTHVHRILQAFHVGARGLPGPWPDQITDSNQKEAETLLLDISQKVFEHDLSRRFLSRGWLYRWTQCIPIYLEWEKQRETRWRVENSELKLEIRIGEGSTQLTLNGRIDRVDRGKDGIGIIDYKTGSTPSLEDIQCGEAIQLPFYALLYNEEKIAEAAYLKLDVGKLDDDKTKLEGAVLEDLRVALGKRLLLLKHKLDSGTPLPAWGDRETCRVCEMEGLCRRAMWTDSGSAP